MRVIVVPRNGYLNRFQAMASASILAQELEAEFSVCWVPQPAAPAPREVVFGEASGLVFTSQSELQTILGYSLESVPHYVNSQDVSGVGKVVTFAGHDLGEQPLMSELSQELRVSEFDYLVIVAGGRFSESVGSQSIDWDSEDFRELRRGWYQALEFAHDIDSVWPDLVREPFLGLHLRYSDRSHQTPSRSEIKRTVAELCRSSGIERVFIASDSRKERDHWSDLLKDLGLSPWFFESDSVGEFAGDAAALVDWRILSHAQAIVYFRESSFGYEAAVASGNFNVSVALAPNPLVSLGVRTRKIAGMVLDVPKRRGWL
jgi:hypothetical protein